MSDNRAIFAVQHMHQRFLLRKLHHTQQFAPMYNARTQALKGRAAEVAMSSHSHLKRGAKSAPPCDALDVASRVLNLEVDKESLVIGTLYKKLKTFRGFLAEYQRELVRIDAGEEDEDGDGEEGGGDGEEMDVPSIDDLNIHSQDPTSDVPASGGSLGLLCTNDDTIVIEDDSGRVELVDAPVHTLVTGMIVAVRGKLNSQGKLVVTELFFPGCPAAPLRQFPAAPPVYVAYVCDLSVGSRASSVLLGKLVSFFGGAYDDGEGIKAASIGQLVIGGNVFEPTEELRLKNKVRLEPADHRRLGDLKGAGGSFSGTSTSPGVGTLADAGSMVRAMDQFISTVATIAAPMHVTVLPGENDPSNAFWPQQPFHRLLLQESSKLETVKVTTNPHEFRVKPVGSDSLTARIFVSSGQNVEDFVRQSRYRSRVEASAAIVHSGCAAPTAPNTLSCYPFIDVDPFVMDVAPHAFVSCNAPSFETSFVDGTRHVVVPSFLATSQVVLMNIASPTLDTHFITL
jgi:DNA polymerase delta subunit 2